MDDLTKSLKEIQEAADALVKSCGGKTKKSEEPAPEEVTDKPIPKGVAGDDVPAKPTEPVTDNPEDSDNPDEEKPMVKSDGIMNEKKDEENEANGDKADGVKNVIHKSEADAEADIRKSFESDPAILSALQNSEFQAAITDVMVKSLAGMTFRVDKLAESILGLAQSQAALAKSMVAAHTADEAITKSVSTEQESLTAKLAELQKSMDSRFDSINKSLEQMGAQPVMRKSVPSVSVAERNFNASIDGKAPDLPAATAFESLNKSLVSQIMEDAVLKGETSVTPFDVCALASGGTIGESAKQYVMQHLPK